MGEVLAAVAWLKANSDSILAVLVALLALGEAVVRLTPTESDDGFVQRVGVVLSKVLDFLGVPNNLKKPELPK
jgi:hypothetical protein